MIKIGDKVSFNKQAIDFGIGKNKNIGVVINIRNKGKGKLVKVLFDNKKEIEINTSWLLPKDI